MEKTAKIIDFIDAYIYRHLEDISHPKHRDVLEHFTKKQDPSRLGDPNVKVKLG